MKAVKAKMFSLMPSSMKSYGTESAVTLRNEVELRMKMNSVSRMVIKVVLVILNNFLPKSSVGFNNVSASATPSRYLDGDNQFE